MAMFRVGQRVRVRWTVPMWRSEVGKEATILSIGARPCEQGCAVSYELDIRHGFGNAHACSCCLEPVQLERNRVVAWEDCAIDPRKIGEPA